MDTYKICLFAVIIFSGLLHVGVSQRLEGSDKKLPNDGICKSIDVRNFARNLEKLRNCSVIAGVLQIVLINVRENVSNYVFPELREITDYLVLYRVETMISLGDMFPNLSLIRGRHLFHNYALVIFDMSRLREIGLKSLTNIERGFVRVDRNPQLCFATTVDWERITGKNHGNHFSDNGISKCPASDVCRGCPENLCWHSKKCQKIPSEKCHPECLGGCNQKGECYRCKHFASNGICVTECPENSIIEPNSMKCISKEICSKIYRGHSWVFENKCTTFCPNGYETVNVNNSIMCEYCGDNCNNTCYGAEITSLAEAQQMRLCHTVRGVLIIKVENIHGGNIMEELEKGLGNIREINGYLKVHRSPGVTSLNFLRNLSIIRGTEEPLNRYAIVVNEMMNLNSLWDWNNKKSFKITPGTLSFHYNPRLCITEIEKLANITNTTYDNYDVCPTSNGYKESCHQIILKADCFNITQTDAMITWERITRNVTEEDIAKNEVGYVLYYFENAHDNISSHASIDSCGRSSWMSEFVAESLNSEPLNFSKHLTDLKPFTRYAYYVESYNKVANRRFEDARSDMKFFMTKMKKPPQPYVYAESLSHDSISVSWKLAPEYKGVITHFTIEVETLMHEQVVLDSIDYCERFMQLEGMLGISNRPNLAMTENEEAMLECDCSEVELPDELKFIDMKEKKNDVLDEDFNCENVSPTDKLETIEEFLRALRCRKITNREMMEIYNTSQLPDVLQSRSKRQIMINNQPENFNIDDFLGIEVEDDIYGRENVSVNGKYHIFSVKVNGDQNNFTITNLQHFTKYIVYVSACIDEHVCGLSAMRMTRTLHLSGADLVKGIRVLPTTKNHIVHVIWDEPKQPNGAIVGYVIQHKRTDIPMTGYSEDCVSRREFLMKSSYALNEMNPGTYVVRIKTLTFAPGKFTEWIPFGIDENMSTLIVLAFLGALLIGGFTFIYFYYIRRKLSPLSEDSQSLVPAQSTDNIYEFRNRRRRRQEVEQFEMQQM